MRSLVSDGFSAVLSRQSGWLAPDAEWDRRSGWSRMSGGTRRSHPWLNSNQLQPWLKVFGEPAAPAPLPRARYTQPQSPILHAHRILPLSPRIAPMTPRLPAALDEELETPLAPPVDVLDAVAQSHPSLRPFLSSLLVLHTSVSVTVQSVELLVHSSLQSLELPHAVEAHYLAML